MFQDLDLQGSVDMLSRIARRGMLWSSSSRSAKRFTGITSYTLVQGRGRDELSVGAEHNEVSGQEY